MAIKSTEEKGRDETTSESIETVKMLRMRENTRDLYQKLTNPKTTDDELKWLATQAFINQSKLKYWLEKIDQYRNQAISIASQPGEHYKSIRDDPEIFQEFVNTVLMEWNAKCKSLDSTSQVASIDFMVTRKNFPYHRIDKKFFLAWAGKGRLLILTGEKDSGKSDWACELAKIAIDNKMFRVISNIELQSDYVNPEDPNYAYVYCKTFSKLIVEVCQAKLKDIPTIIIVDEAGIEFASYEQTTTRAKEFDKFAKLTRKFATNVIYITQYWAQVPFIFKENCSAWMEKQKKRSLLRYAIYQGDERGFDDYIEGIPPTTMPFDTDHISGMTMNLRFKDIFDFLDSLPPKVNQFEALMNWVLDQEQKPEEKELKVNEKKLIAQKLIAEAKKHPNDVRLSINSLAKLLNVSPETIHRWSKGYKGLPEDEGE